jgi:hypothetical protein
MAQTEADRLETVRKLLAKAESSTHPEEARTFTAKAQELMTRWAIDDAMLAAAQSNVETTGRIDANVINVDANEYRGPKIQLLNTVALNNDVRLVLIGKQRYIPDPSRPTGRRRVQVIEMIGTEKDRAWVELLWTSLLAQAESEFNLPETVRLMRDEMDWVEPNKRGGFRIRWHNTFMNGYCSGVQMNLAKARRATVEAVTAEYGEASESVTLVLASKAQRVENELARRHPKLGRSNGSSAGQGSYDAHVAGRQAGERADVGRPRVGGNRPQLGG